MTITKEAVEAARRELGAAADHIPGHERPFAIGHHVQLLLDAREAQLQTVREELKLQSNVSEGAVNSCRHLRTDIADLLARNAVLVAERDEAKELSRDAYILKDVIAMKNRQLSEIEHAVLDSNRTYNIEKIVATVSALKAELEATRAAAAPVKDKTI